VPDQTVMRKPERVTNPAWRIALPVLLFGLAWILFWYWDTASGMVAIWFRSETFTHALLVPPISLWLIWRRRRALAALPPNPAPLLLLPMALAGFAWLLGDLAAVNAITFLAMVSLLVLAVPALLGTRVALVILFPLAYLFFAVPIGEFALPQMMEWTAEFTIVALRLTGIPVYREGLSFVIPSGNWSVVEACSGVRYLIASVVVGTLYAYLNYRSTKRRLIFVAVSFVVPIIANWLRAYMIVMLGHLSGNRLAVGVDHLIYGWVFFGVVILLMFLIGSRWAETPDNDDEGPVAFLGAPAALFPVGRLLLTMAVLALVVVVPHIWNAAIERPDVGDPPEVALPSPPGWQVVSPAAIDFRPAFINPVSELRGEYARNQQTVGVFIGYYRNQTYERKLITSTNALVKTTDHHWRKVASAVREMVLDGQSVSVRTTELLGPGEVRLVAWQWYWTNNRLTGSDYSAKAWTAWSRLTAQGDDSAVVVLYAPRGQAGDGEAALTAFASEGYPAIEVALRRVQGAAVAPLR
jgi:exosortase A